MPRQDLQTQQIIHGEARSSRGEVTNAMTPKPTRMPTTWKWKRKPYFSSYIILNVYLPPGVMAFMV